MARLFVNASSQYLEYAGAIVSAPPFTIATFGWIDNFDSYQTLVSLTDPDTQNIHELYITTNERISALSNSGSSSQSQSTGVQAQQWHHFTGVWATTTSRLVYLDGVAGSENTDNVAPTVTTTNVGVEKFNSGTAGLLDGSLAEMGIWNVALTVAELLILAAGYSPLFVRPQNLTLYMPLIRDDDEDIVGGLSFSSSGSPTVSAHPRIIRPAMPMLGLPIAAVAAGGTTHTVVCSDGIVLNVTDGSLMGLFGMATDSVNVDDITTGKMALLATATDSINVDDSSIVKSIILTVATDGISVNDTTISLMALLASAADGIDLSDTASGLMALLASASDSIDVNDSAVALSIIFATAVDGVDFGDSATSLRGFFPIAADGINLSDSAASLMALFAKAADGINLNDVAIIVEDLITGELRVTFSSKKSTITFTVKKPGIDFAAKKPGIDFS